MRITLRNLTILLLIFWTAHTNAQGYQSNLGRFEIDEIKGCAPHTVNLNQLVSVGTFDIRWGDGTAEQDAYTHTYDNAGTYFIEVDYPSMLPFRTDTIEITVVQNIQPSFEIQQCNGHELNVHITDSNYDAYAIDYNNDGTDEVLERQGNPVPSHQYPGAGTYTIKVRGVNDNAADNCDSNNTAISTLDLISPSFITEVKVSDISRFEISYNPIPNTLLQIEYSDLSATAFQPLDTLDNSGFYEIDNAVIFPNNYTTSSCFRISSIDPCNSQEYYSNTVCSPPFKTILNDGSIDMTWDNHANIDHYTLCKNGDCSINITTNSYIDTDVVCKVNYCYELTAYYTDGARSISTTTCGIAQSTSAPQAVTNIVSLIDNKAVDLIWEEPGFTPVQYNIYKTLTADLIKYPYQTLTPDFSDILPDNEQKACYQISYPNSCNNNSPDYANICPLQPTYRLNLNNEVELNWEEYTGYETGIAHYRIEKYDQNGIFLNSFSSNLPLFLDAEQSAEQVFLYRIFAVPADGSLTESHSDFIKVIKNSFISRPQAFTPNGDGLNDTLEFSGTYIEMFQIKIFNRWGELMFESDSMDTGWDGTYKGKLLPGGTYTYRVKLTDLAQRKWEVNGLVALIRK